METIDEALEIQQNDKLTAQRNFDHVSVAIGSESPMNMSSVDDFINNAPHLGALGAESSDESNQDLLKTRHSGRKRKTNVRLKPIRNIENPEKPLTVVQSPPVSERQQLLALKRIERTVPNSGRYIILEQLFNFFDSKTTSCIVLQSDKN